MKTNHQAPGWVMTGMLTLWLLSAIVWLLQYGEILPVEVFSFSNEYGESVSLTFSYFSCILYLLYIIYFGVVAVLSFRNGWSRLVSCGTLLIVAANIIFLIFAVSPVSVDDYYEARSFFENDLINVCAVVMEIIGILLLIWSIEVSKTVKIITAIVTIVNALLSLPIFYMSISESYPYFKVVEALIFVALIVMCNKPEKSLEPVGINKNRSTNRKRQWLVLAIVFVISLIVILLFTNTCKSDAETDLVEAIKESDGEEHAEEAAVEETGEETTVTEAFDDTGLLSLAGTVESVSYKREGADEPYMTVKFNRDGSLIVPAKTKVFRDDRNRIIKYERFVQPDSEDNFTYTFNYIGDNRYPSRYDKGDMGSNASYELTYGEDGALSTVRCGFDLEGDTDTYETTLTYAILAKDSRGNWTRRSVEEERIENYEIENALGELSPRQHVTNDSYTETRTIKYHSK